MILSRVKAGVSGLIPSGAQNRSSRCFAPTRQACGLVRDQLAQSQFVRPARASISVAVMAPLASSVILDLGLTPRQWDLRPSQCSSTGRAT
jgi:hypothetical protein